LAYQKFYQQLGRMNQSMIVEIGTGHPEFNLENPKILSHKFSVCLVFCLLDPQICRRRCLDRAEADPEREFKLDSLERRLSRIFPDQHKTLAKNLSFKYC